MKQIFVIALLTLLVVGVLTNFLLGNLTKTGITDPGTGIEKGDTPPQFTLENLQGEQMKLSDFEGKKVILNFWATWCQPCRAEMPAFLEYSKQNKDVVVLAVNMTHKDSAAKIESFVEDTGLTFPIVLDEEGDVSKAYSVINIPSTYFIDEQGIIQLRVDGAIDETNIDFYIKQM